MERLFPAYLRCAMDTVVLSVCTAMAVVSVYDVNYHIVAGIANVFVAVTANQDAYYGNNLADSPEPFSPRLSS